MLQEVCSLQGLRIGTERVGQRHLGWVYMEPNQVSERWKKQQSQWVIWSMQHQNARLARCLLTEVKEKEPERTMRQKAGQNRGENRDRQKCFQGPRPTKGQNIARSQIPMIPRRPLQTDSLCMSPSWHCCGGGSLPDLTSTFWPASSIFIQKDIE